MPESLDMPKRLDRYLAEISHYLAVKQGSEEILTEIRSHILEKAETEFGDSSDESIAKVIAAYGKPREVAEQYLDGNEIISGAFKKHLFRYTAILFAVHLTAAIIGVFFRVSVVVLPFFYVPRMSVLGAVFYVPMALLYDFGLVALLLYIVTQRNRDIRLPWPHLFHVGAGRPQLRRPRLIVLASLLALLTALVFCFVRFDTIFFYSVNFGKPVSLLNPASAVVYSLLFIAIYACAICAYVVRFLINSAWVNLVGDAVVLLLLWTVWNLPIRPEFKPVLGFDTRPIGILFVVGLILIATGRFIWDLVLVTRERAGRAAWRQ